MAEPIALKSEAFIGFAASAVTLLIALAIFPADATPNGALALPATILSVGIMVVPIMRAIRRSPDLLNCENLVAFGYVFWLLLDLIQGAYDLSEATDGAIRDAFIAIGVSASAMWLGVAGRPWPLPKWIAEIALTPMDTKTVGRLVPLCFVLGMFNFAYATNFDLPLMWSYVGEQRWAAPWGRGQLGGWDAFLDQMQYFGYVLPSLTALLISRRGFTLQAWFSVVLSGIMITFLAQGGGRRIIGVTIGAAIIVWIQAQRDLSVRRLTLAAGAALALLAGMQFMLNIRTVGYEEFAFTGESEYDYLHVDDNFLRLSQVIQIVPAEHAHVGFQQLWFTIVRPVPRVFWPSKPVDPGFDLPSIVGMKGVSLSTSIIGEWYLSFGWLAVVFGGWLHGRMSKTVNVLREKEAYHTNPIVYGLAVMILVSGMRSMIELVLMSYALIAWWAANRLTRQRAVATR
jgi:oligosaccharide repeat unit polymerase